VHSRAVDVSFSRPASSVAEGQDPHSGFFVVAGTNGSGKSTLLRSIAACLAGPELAGTLSDSQSSWVSHGSSSATATVEIARGGEGLVTGAGKTAEQFTAGLKWERIDGGSSRPKPYIPSNQTGGKMAERGLWSAKPTGWFAAGYGPFRRISGSSGEAARLVSGDWTIARFATLFREEASLAEAVQWLQQVNYRARSGRDSYSILEERVLRLLSDGLFPENVHALRVDPDGLWVSDAGVESRVDEMSDGYRTVTALVTDIIRQIHQCYSETIEWTETVTGSVQVLTSGVVLIDEIDVHLHVSWQRSIGPWLTTHFPNIQFIVTTHSPFIAQTADPGGLIRIPRASEGRGPGVVNVDLFDRVTKGSADDAVLSELFGLDSPFSKEVDAKRDRLAFLERRVVRDLATTAETAEFADLVADILPSPMSRASQVARTLRE